MNTEENDLIRLAARGVEDNTGQLQGTEIGILAVHDNGMISMYLAEPLSPEVHKEIVRAMVAVAQDALKILEGEE